MDDDFQRLHELLDTLAVERTVDEVLNIAVAEVCLWAQAKRREQAVSEAVDDLVEKIAKGSVRHEE